MSATAEKSKHIHKEAFALMQYACTGSRGGFGRPATVGCGHRETIWNSRDGVTPFGCGCPSCGKTLYHVEWQRDTYAPDHKLHPGQNFWRDGTPDEAEAIMRRRIERMRAEYPCTPEKVAELVKMARDGGDSGEFQMGWPTLDQAPR